MAEKDQFFFSNALITFVTNIMAGEHVGMACAAHGQIFIEEQVGF
jgi:hypothetical protein